MTLTARLLAELQRLGSATHPLARTLPSIIAEHNAYALKHNRVKKLCLLLSGMLLGGSLSLALIWQRLDAISTRNDVMAAACLNPVMGKATSKAAAQVMTARREEGREP